MTTIPLSQPSPTWCSRTEQLFGADALLRLESSHVLVVGVGGVGAYAAEMVVRAGVGHITLIDADVVNPSNINRQLVALHSTVGELKVEVLGRRLLDINPSLVLHTHPIFLDQENVEALLSAHAFDFVVDAIDTLTPKIALIVAAAKQQIPIVSSMGAGAKSDPSKVGFSDIAHTHHCALAKAVRTRLKAEGFNGKLPVVFSTEEANRNAILYTENERNKRSTTGTVSYLPAIFGCFLASHVIQKLITPPRL